MAEQRYNDDVMGALTSEYVPDAQVLKNQEDAARLGVVIPGLSGAIPDAIRATALKNQPILNLTQPRPATQLQGLGGAIGAATATNISDFQTQLSSQRDFYQQSRQTSLDAYLKGLLSTPGEVAMTDEAYRGSVDPAREKLNKLDNQILQEEHSLRRRLEALDKNPEGLFGGALAAEKVKIERESLSRQADLAVIRMAAAGDYAIAKEIADRAVQAKLEVNKNRIEALKINYEDYKDLFSTAEQRAFDLMLSREQGAYEMERAKEMARFEQMMRENDPLYQAQLAKAYSDITAPDTNPPEVKEINGVDSQWNPTTGQWEPITGITSPKDQMRIDNRVVGAEIVIGKVDEAVKQLSGATTGFVGGFSQYIPGTPARNLATTIDTIKSRIGFDTLQAMREASPTGGALGQVAVQELEMLQSAVASLDVGQSQQQLEQNLQAVKRHYAGWLRTVGYVIAPDGQVVQITN